MKRTLILLLLSALLVVSLAGCREETTPDQVTIAMGFIPNVQFTPMYVALERGYFADEGLEVGLDYGMETDLLQRLGAGDLPFAIASGDQVVLARAQGLPVVYVANWYRTFPVSVVSLASEGIEAPEDLVGRTVGIPVLEGASYIGWRAFLSKVGIAPEQVDLQAIGYTQVASLTEERVAAAVSYAMNEPVQLEQAGHEINTFALSDYTRLVSNGLISSDSVVSEQPELVQKVVTAFLKGIEDTLADPDAAFAITRQYIPEMDDAAAVGQRAVLDECLRYWAGEPLGYNDPAHWQESVSLLRDLGLLTTDLDPEQLYTNQFITP